MNFVVLTGRLVRDPELRHTQSGTATASFTLAVDKQITKDKKEEMKAAGKPTADFPRITTWGRTAEMAANNLTKGRKVLVEGVLTTGQYKDSNDVTHYTTDVVANKIEFMDSNHRSESQSPAGSSDNYGPDFTGSSFEDDSEVPF